MKLIKLSASWCQSCKQLTKTIEGIPLPFDVISVDIDEQPELAIKYNCRSVPTLVLLDNDDNVLRKTSGNMSAEQFKKWVAPT